MQKLEEFLKITGAINDESRLKILAFLSLYSQDMLCVCDLVESLAMNQSRLSRHLKILKDAGFLELQRKGVWAYYGIKKDLADSHKDILRHIKLLGLSLPPLKLHEQECK